MKKIALITINIIFIMSFGNIMSMDRSKKDTVLVFDLDDVVSFKQKPSIPSFLKVGAPIILKHPTLAFKIKTIAKKGKELAKGKKTEDIEPVNGTSNIIYNLFKWLEDEYGYKGLIDYTEKLVGTSVNPIPNIKVIQLIKDLKNKGYGIFAATNQDDIQNKFYREKMREQGIKVDQLFEGVITAQGYDKKHENPKGYVTTQYAKPQEQYFKVVKATVQKEYPKAKILFIDDKGKNIESAKKIGLVGIQFKNIEQLETALKKNNVSY